MPPSSCDITAVEMGVMYEVSRGSQQPRVVMNTKVGHVVYTPVCAVTPATVHKKRETRKRSSDEFMLTIEDKGG